MFLTYQLETARIIPQWMIQLPYPNGYKEQGVQIQALPVQVWDRRNWGLRQGWLLAEVLLVVEVGCHGKQLLCTLLWGHWQMSCSQGCQQLQLYMFYPAWSTKAVVFLTSTSLKHPKHGHKVSEVLSDEAMWSYLPAQSRDEKSFLLPHPPIPCHMYLSEAHKQFCPPHYMYIGFYLPFESISLAPQSFLLLFLNFILLKINKDQRWQLLHEKGKISSPLIPINNIRPNFQKDI